MNYVILIFIFLYFTLIVFFGGGGVMQSFHKVLTKALLTAVCPSVSQAAAGRLPLTVTNSETLGTGNGHHDD